MIRALLSALLLLICSNLCLSIVTEPVDDISAIRLSPPKKQETGHGQQATRPTMPAATQQKPVSAKHGVTTEALKTGSKASPPKVMLNITEPPQGSILLGSTFAVKIDILAPDTDSFLSQFNTTESKVCASLNAGPFYCWPALAGRIFYTEVEENEYTLEAMLYSAGKLHYSSRTTTVFKMVRDAKLAESATDDEVSNDAADQTYAEASAQIQVDYPRVGVSSPNNLVTYPGHSVSLHFDLEANDVDSFQHYFANAFVCVNVDHAPAFSCFAIFGDENYAAPLVLNLPNGKHTMEAALTHPETGEVLESSKSTTSTFFTAGELLEAATIAVDVTVADERHVVPLIEGTNLDAQTSAFCDSVGMAESKTCKERVKHKLWSAWEDMLESL